MSMSDGLVSVVTIAILIVFARDSSCSKVNEHETLFGQHIIEFICQVFQSNNNVLVVHSNNHEFSAKGFVILKSIFDEASKRFVPFTHYDDLDNTLDFNSSNLAFKFFTQFNVLLVDFNIHCVILLNGQDRVLIFLKKDKIVNFVPNPNVTKYVEKGQLKIIHHDFLTKTPNYHLKNVTIASVITYPFVNEMNTAIDNEIMKVVAKKFNFTPDFVHPDDNQWGNYYNGAWSGVVGMLQRKAAQFAVGQLSRIPLREEFIDFTYPYAWDSVTFIIRTPRHLPKAVILIKPFSREVWLGTLFSFLIVSIILKLILIFEEKEVHYSSIVLYLFGSLFLQGSSFHNDTSLKIRCVIACWWILCIVLVVLYSSCLISMFNVDIYEKGIETRKDLERAIRKGEYVGGTVNGSTFLMNINNSYDGTFGEIRKAILKDKSLITSNLRIGVTKSLRENYAFIFSAIALKSYAQAMTSTGSKMFMLSDDRYYTTCYGIGTTKGYPYKLAMDKIVRSLVESGLIRYWKRRVISMGLPEGHGNVNLSSVADRVARRRNLIVQKEPTFSFSLKDVKIAFDILWIGFVTAIAACFVELIFLNCLKVKRKPQEETEKTEETKKSLEQ